MWWSEASTDEKSGETNTDLNQALSLQKAKEIRDRLFNEFRRKNKASTEAAATHKCTTELIKEIEEALNTEVHLIGIQGSLGQVFLLPSVERRIVSLDNVVRALNESYFRSSSATAHDSFSDLLLSSLGNVEALKREADEAHARFGESSEKYNDLHNVTFREEKQRGVRGSGNEKSDVAYTDRIHRNHWLLNEDRRQQEIKSQALCSGYVKSYSHSQFFNRYRMLGSVEPKKEAKSKSRKLVVLVHSLTKEMDEIMNEPAAKTSSCSSALFEGIQVGKTKVFLRQQAFDLLERMREAKKFSPGGKITMPFGEAVVVEYCNETQIVTADMLGSWSARVYLHKAVVTLSKGRSGGESRRSRLARARKAEEVMKLEERMKRIEERNLRAEKEKTLATYQHNLNRQLDVVLDPTMNLLGYKRKKREGKMKEYKGRYIITRDDEGEVKKYGKFRAAQTTDKHDMDNKKRRGHNYRRKAIIAKENMQKYYKNRKNLDVDSSYVLRERVEHQLPPRIKHRGKQRRTFQKKLLGVARCEQATGGRQQEMEEALTKNCLKKKRLVMKSCWHRFGVRFPWKSWQTKARRGVLPWQVQARNSVIEESFRHSIQAMRDFTSIFKAKAESELVDAASAEENTGAHEAAVYAKVVHMVDEDADEAVDTSNHPEEPVKVEDATVFGRNYFNRASAPKVESVEANECAAILADALAMKKSAVDYLHPEVGVTTTVGTACGRNFFNRYSAPKVEDTEDATECARVMADVMADVMAMKKNAVDYLHPEVGVVTSDSYACGHNYFERAIENVALAEEDTGAEAAGSTVESDADVFPVNIKTVTGLKFSINMHPNDTLRAMKHIIFDHWAAPPCTQRLIFSGKYLTVDSATLADCLIEANDTVIVTMPFQAEGSDSDKRFLLRGKWKVIHGGKKFLAPHEIKLLSIVFGPDELEKARDAAGFLHPTRKNMLKHVTKTCGHVSCEDLEKIQKLVDGPLMTEDSLSLREWNVLKLQEWTLKKPHYVCYTKPQVQLFAKLSAFGYPGRSITDVRKEVLTALSLPYGEEVKFDNGKVYIKNVTYPKFDCVKSWISAKDIAIPLTPDEIVVLNTLISNGNLEIVDSPRNQLAVIPPSPSSSDQGLHINTFSHSASAQQSNVVTPTVSSAHSISMNSEVSDIENDSSTNQATRAASIIQRSCRFYLKSNEERSVERTLKNTPLMGNNSSLKPEVLNALVKHLRAWQEKKVARNDRISLLMSKDDTTPKQELKELQLLKKNEEAIENLFDTIAHVHLESKTDKIGIVEIKPKVKGKVIERVQTKTLFSVPQKGACKPGSTEASQQSFVRRQTKKVNAFIDTIIDQESELGQEMADRVLKQLGEDKNYIIIRKENLELSIEDVVVLRDAMGTSTNAIARLKVTIEALNEHLKIIPSCIKARLAQYEGSGNLEVHTVKHQLIVTKDESRQKQLPFTYLTRPWQLVQRIVEKITSEASYETSQEWMKLRDKCVFTLNIDKGGDDINTSIRCANMMNGNSKDATFSVAVVGGPVSECLQNEKETIFNDSYPIKQFLHHMTNNSYFILKVTTLGKKRQCRSMVFLPSSPGVNCDISAKVELLKENVDESQVKFDDAVSSSAGAPEVDISLDSQVLSIKLVKSGDAIVGVQLLHDGDPLHTQKFDVPLQVGESPPDISLQQIIGFPVNDMKQQLVVIGIKSNSCSYACPVCTCKRENFDHLSESIYNRMIEREIDVTGFRQGQASSRLDKMSVTKCKARYDKLTHNGKITPTDTKYKQIVDKCASVSEQILWDFHPAKNSGEPLHLSSGTINHTFDNMRKKIRAFEKNSSFFTEAEEAKTFVEAEMDKCATTFGKMKNKDSKHLNQMVDVHKANMKIRRKTSTNEKRIRLLNELQSYDPEIRGNVEEEKIRFSASDLLKSSEDIDEELLQLHEEISVINKEVIDHAEESGYAHGTQLYQGMMLFHDGLSKFLSSSSKRAHGKLEFIFNNALEYIGGGKFSAENGGFDQTNGRALSSLEKFDDIAEVCVKAFGQNSELEQLFEGFKNVAHALFILAKMLKSQGKLDHQKLEDAIIDFIVEFRRVFPGVPYFNKLHFIVMHVPEFVRKYGCLGRLSAESHESVHANIARTKDIVKRMVSTKKKYITLFARSMSGLKDGISYRKSLVEKKRTGKKRGNYNSKNMSSKAQDDVEFICTEYSETTTFNGEEFLVLPLHSGLIHHRYKDTFLYVTQGKAPIEWVESFGNFLSPSKVEDAKYSTY